MLAEVGSRLKPEWSHSCRNTAPSSVPKPVKLEDGEVSNDSQSLLPPAPFTPVRPVQIQVKVRNFEEAHNL
jgi:hypothetical protein